MFVRRLAEQLVRAFALGYSAAWVAGGSTSDGIFDPAAFQGGVVAVVGSFLLSLTATSFGDADSPLFTE